MDIPNYDNFHGGGGFSHVYVIMHKYFVNKPKNAKNVYISFYIQLNLILSLMNRKNQPNGKKGIILLVAFSKWIL